MSRSSDVIARVWLIDSSQMQQFLFAPFFIHDSHVLSCWYYTDGYKITTLVCSPFTCCAGLLLGAVAVVLLGEGQHCN